MIKLRRSILTFLTADFYSIPQMPNNNEIIINGIKNQKTQRQFNACRTIPPKVGPSAGAIPVPMP